ncbi:MULTISPECIES: hypothetical protein [unclassified Pseudomonas]|uniref:hypothetical protein n=1 Tax=unclassified Pseudomonas TaxID=196821 RepID=UPI002448B3EB|nr:MULTISPECIES: hypothetical protein [unclassified Pseudomonas]MDG9928399.1 hypothetical protein [Pseudomonas sp. GD04042]MDH0482569.1 hypothetical protein [Pseudomonas sp. GD04015]MDH0604729.1 hypothetical protein [Pseudomonas sp. GD03869]
MTALLKLLPGWAWVAAAGLVLTGIVGAGQQVRVVGLQGELADLRKVQLEDAGKLAACRETRANLLVLVGEQNQALAGLRAADQERAQRAQAAQQQARQHAEQDYHAANRLMQERTGGDACAAAEAVINQELGL